MINWRLVIVFLLGFSSGLPFSLITTTLQAWYAEQGVSLMTTGLLSLVGLPYLYRVFWGPFVDRYPLFSIGRRKSWILTTQVLLIVGFNILAWQNPEHYPHMMAAIALALAFISATQDIAVDAQRIEYLPASFHGLAASAAVFGYRLALMIAGGLSLVMAHRFGWTVTYRLMSLLMAIGVIATLCSQEPEIIITSEKTNLKASFLEPIKELWVRPGFVALVLFILFFKLGEAFTSTSSGIMMPFLIQGLGFSLDAIGYINKILGVAAILCGSCAAGFLLIRWSLFKSLLFFGLCQALANILFIVLAMTGKNLMLFALAAVCDNFAAGMSSTALVAFFMRMVNQRFTATQFSLLVGIASIPRVFSGPLAVLLQSHLGWVGLYQCAFFLSLCFIPLLFYTHSKWFLARQSPAPCI